MQWLILSVAFGMGSGNEIIAFVGVEMSLFRVSWFLDGVLLFDGCWWEGDPV